MEKRVVTTPWGKEIHLDELARIHPIDGILSNYEQCRLLVTLNLTVQEDAVIRAIVTTFSGGLFSLRSLTRVKGLSLF